jgi:hypothetical protein
MIVGRSLTMNLLKRIAVVVSLFAAVAIFLPSANAADRSWNFPGDGNWPTMTTFDEPVQIGNLVLSPGTYLIQRNPSIYSSRVAMVYSVDRDRWEGIVIGVAARRSGSQMDHILSTIKQEGGKPDAIRYWFYQGWSDGIEFRYSNIQTTNVAKQSGKAITTIASSAK